MQFRAGHGSIKDEKGGGQLCSMRSADNVQKVKRIVEINCKVTMREIAEHTSISRETVRLILPEELGMRKMYVKVVPKVLSPDQEQMGVKLLVSCEC